MKTQLGLAWILLALASRGFAKDIDWDFISKLEGGQQLKAYVPDPKMSMSGVTLATGFDLGARNETDLTDLGLDKTLIAKLTKYLGKKGEEAQKFLTEHPLAITQPEADAIDKASKADAITKLTTSYDGASAAKFDTLKKEAQTVIASVSFQYGDLKTKTPTFWKYVIKQDWNSAVRELYNFKDKYETRRFKEGDYLLPLTSLPKISKSVGNKGDNVEADVKVLQQLLKDKGVYQGQISGKADQATIDAIVMFQKSIGGVADGRVDPGQKTYRRLVAF